MDNFALLFNGKSIRNAILQKLAEDHNLSQSLFTNSNITILVDIISYMYQSLMTNLKFAAGESMFSESVLYENVTRLSKLIGYYAQGAYPYSLIAKIQSNNNVDFSSLSTNFLTTKIAYGPYSYNFALVDDVFSTNDVLDNTKYIRLVLGDWALTNYVANGEKFEEFVLPVYDDKEKYISQQHINVFIKNKFGDIEVWNYDESPLFSVLSKTVGIGNRDRLVTSSNSEERDKWNRFNFYLDENNRYILKFGDGISSNMPNKDDEIIVVYLTSNYRANNITEKDINSISNAPPSKISKSGISEKLKEFGILSTTDIEDYSSFSIYPTTNLAGFKPIDDTEMIKANSRSAFNRQQRVVTKSDYKSYLFEYNSLVKDCLIQNNWDFISTFYGYIFNLAKQVVIRKSDNYSEDPNERGLEFINQAVNFSGFTSIDSADANNVYIWVLSKGILGINDNWIEQKGNNLKFGFVDGYTSLYDIFKNVKSITEHIVEVKPIWRTYCPFVSTREIISNGYIDLLAMQEFSDVDSVDELLKNTKSYINIYADVRYINNIARIKSSINKLIKEYFYDDIKLGITPSVSNLSKDILNITGVNSITTRYFDEDLNDLREVPGMQFVSWTAGQILNQPVCFDAFLSHGLPQINPFEYLKCAIGYEDFISKFIKISPDHSRK